MILVFYQLAAKDQTAVCEQVSQRLRELLANDGKRWSGEEASSDSGGNAMLGSIRGKRDRDASSMGENKTLNGTSYCRTSFDFPQAKGASLFRNDRLSAESAGLELSAGPPSCQHLCCKVTCAADRVGEATMLC